MRLIAVTLLLLTPAPELKGDAAKILGTWIPVSATTNGNKVAEETLALGTFLFDSKTLTVTEGDKKVPCTYVLDPKAKLPSIDVTATEGEFKGKTYRCIYELDGNTLKLCIPQDPRDLRPKEFTGDEGSKCSLLILKRKKANPDKP